MIMASRPAVFLDRDGVLIEATVHDGKPFAAVHPEQVHIIGGVPQACERLSRLGYLLVMVTNQPDVARGKISRAFVEQTNARIAYTLRLDGVETCLHDDADRCNCRKPLPGLIIMASEKLSIDLSGSIMVGDRWRDVEAGRNAGCRTVFIDCGYDEVLRTPPDHTASSLLAAVDWIQTQSQGGNS